MGGGVVGGPVSRPIRSSPPTMNRCGSSPTPATRPRTGFHLVPGLRPWRVDDARDVPSVGQDVPHVAAEQVGRLVGGLPRHDVVVHGPTTYASLLTSCRDRCCPPTSISPVASWLSSSLATAVKGHRSRPFGSLTRSCKAALVASSAPDLLGLTGFRVGGLTCRLAVDPFFLSGASCWTAVSGPLPSGCPRRTSDGWPASAREFVGAPLGRSRC